ncbi:PepSY domain-containing protein [Rhizobium sp. ARZ01]|uniref:PepSY domain-containing protein n=1 Tax=Rhizobium sp. ARZ01 TaxID=2769313 RepID=UPI00177D3C32|nr:PepSY domain-containing protein [Rhizobium sp. ARZ01]MBD9371794.1 PepSY domain-containing protein [Rhizobium sp. ARZ01]
MKTSTIGAIALLMACSAAWAQSNVPAAKPADKPAIVMPGDQNPVAPVTGENSFTEDQAKERIGDAGYTGISDLNLDESGVWRAKAIKDGKPVVVSLDYQGNIVAN